MCEAPSAARGYHIKVVLVGDAQVGKSSLNLRFTRDEPVSSCYLPTIGIDLGTKDICCSHYGLAMHRIKLWDTAGVPRFAVSPSYMKGAAFVIYCYDVSRRDTLRDIEERWLPSTRYVLAERTQALPTMLLGLKADLPQDQHEVSSKEAAAFAAKHKISITREISVKNASRMQLDELFDNVATWALVQALCRGTAIALRGSVRLPPLPCDVPCLPLDEKTAQAIINEIPINTGTFVFKEREKKRQQQEKFTALPIPFV